MILPYPCVKLAKLCFLFSDLPGHQLSGFKSPTFANWSQPVQSNRDENFGNLPAFGQTTIKCKPYKRRNEARETFKVQLTPASEANERARMALAIALLHLVTWAAFLRIDKAILEVQLVNCFGLDEQKNGAERFWQRKSKLNTPRQVDD